MYYNKNAFIEIDGIKYFGYELYYFGTIWGRRKTNNNEFVVDSTIRDVLGSPDFPSVNTTISPSKGTKIYLAPNCPYGIEDIRNNYTVKRHPDSGDYNVLSPLKSRNCYHTLAIVTLAILPSKRAIIATDVEVNRDKMFEEYVQKAIPDADNSEMLYKSFPGYFCFSIINDSDIFRMFLAGELTKPCISYRQLDINSENELTMDVLQLVYTTGSADRWQNDAEKNFLIQLNVLNQHNWRKYRGTINLLFRELLANKCGIFSIMCRQASRYSKPVQELLKVADGKDGFDSENDFLLAQRFVNGILDIGDCRFTSLTDLLKKLRSVGLSVNSFSRLFSNIVRLSPNHFENEEKD